MDLIREHDYFMCDLYGVVYKCYVELHIGWYTGQRITVNVKKYSEKKFWIFKYKVLDFEYENTVTLSPMSKFVVKGENYFCPEYVRELVDRALWCRKNKIRDQLAREKFENSVKVVTKI